MWLIHTVIFFFSLKYFWTVLNGRSYILSITFKAKCKCQLIFFNPVEEHLLLIHCIKETENFIGLNQLNVKLNLNYILHNIMWYWNCKETVKTNKHGNLLYYALERQPTPQADSAEFIIIRIPGYRLYTQFRKVKFLCRIP